MYHRRSASTKPEPAWRRRERARRTQAHFSARSLSQLLCGEVFSEGIAKIALQQLAATIGTFGARLVRFLHGTDPNDLVSFAPFCARVLLENGCAALVARLDPFRVMYLTEFQSQKEYTLGKRAKTGFAWSTDVMPEGKNIPLWDVDYEIPKISRALFSNHMDHIYWKNAVEDAIDFMSGPTADPMLSDFLALDTEKFLASTRGNVGQLYSVLSKGVHWEFFNSLLPLDEPTVKTSIQSACITMANLGLVSHFIPTAYASIDKNRAVQAYVDFRRLVS